MSETGLKPSRVEFHPLPCPLCESDKYIGVLRHIPMPLLRGHKSVTGESYHCVSCGLMCFPTTDPSFLVGNWNQLVRLIRRKQA